MCWIRELRVSVSVFTSWQLSMRTPQPRSTIWRQQTQTISSKVGRHSNICHLRWRVHLNSNMLITSNWVELKRFYGTIPRNLQVLISILFAICEQIVMWCRVWDVLSWLQIKACGLLVKLFSTPGQWITLGWYFNDSQKDVTVCTLSCASSQCPYPPNWEWR